MTVDSSVLIVEDEMIVACDLGGKLEDLGYSVCSIAATGERALSEADHHQPELVLMDIRLAGVLDGVETARQIQEKYDIPVVYLTAHSDEATLTRAKSTSPFGFILKPFDDIQLAIQVELALLKHKNERRIREQRKWLEVTLKSIADGVIATDGEERILFMNTSAETITGWREKEVMGERFNNIFQLAGETNIDSRENISNPVFLKTKDSRKTPIEQSKSPIHNDSGQIIGTVITFQDITEQLIAEEQLKHIRDLLTKAQTMARMGSWEHDHASGEIFLSDEVFRIFGLEQGMVIPSYELFLQCVHPDDREYVKTEYARSIESKSKEYDIEHRIIRPDWTIRHLHQKCEHHRNKNDEVIRSVGMVHDITEQKIANQKLQQSNRELEQFAYMASHDLKSPLVALKGFLQIIEHRYGEQIEANGREIISRSLQSVERMKSLIHDLLNFSRAASPQSIAKRTDLDILAREVLEDIQPEVSRYGAEIRLQPLPTINVHPNQFKRLLQNLIINGIKYNSSVLPQITISCHERPMGYHFCIEDNGLGIAPAYHDSIFELFQRLHTKREYEGTGMGLAICKKVIEQHGGTLWVESEPGKGSSFHFTLAGN